MLRTGEPMIAAIAVFCAGLAMAPVFPTTLGVVGNVFRRMTATAMGIVITRAEHRERGFVLSEAGALLHQPALYLLALTLFLYVACEVGVFNWLVAYLVSQGLAENFAQNILAFGFALGLLVGRLVVSRILLGVSELKVMLWTSVAMTTKRVRCCTSRRYTCWLSRCFSTWRAR